MKLRFAFAVNNEGKLQKRRFGDADKYLIYSVLNDEMVFLEEETNIYKSIDEQHEHGSIKKGMAIIQFLKEKKINVLVSKQFGKNIKMINGHFIPVRIEFENPDEIIPSLNKHIHWIEDEWKNKKSGFNMFFIKSGILKTKI